MNLRYLGLALVLIVLSPLQVLSATDMMSYNLHISNGLRDIQNGKLYYARKEFEFIVRHEEWDPIHRSVAYLNLGVISSMEQNWASAVKNYEAAIQTNPSYAEAYFNLGGAYYKQALLKKAEEAFLKALEIQPEYGRAHYALGFVYFDQKKYDLAETHAEKALEYGVPYKTLKEKLAKAGR